jgi:hypothetical protein
MTKVILFAMVKRNAFTSNALTSFASASATK